MRVGLGVGWLCLLLLASCELQPIKPPPMRMVDQTQPSRWYDPTYLEYYDAWGLVRRIKEEERTLKFNRDGRLLSQQGEGYETRYTYRPDGKLGEITSYRDGKPYRLTRYHYDVNAKLQETYYRDFVSGEQFHTRHQIQTVPDGRFESDYAVELIALPLHKQFDSQSQLVWSSASDFNQGPGRFYYLGINDSVISARIDHENTPQMRGVGGYGYEYDDQGRLKKITSYNDNNLKAYHTTTYRYTPYGWLESEYKVYTGRSLFNDVIDIERWDDKQEVLYRRYEFDPYGNWTYREFAVRKSEKPERFHQRRSIEYFEVGITK